MINRKMKIKPIIIAVLSTLLLSTGLSAYAESTVIEAYAMDTIAGSPSVIRSSQITVNTDVTFTVSKPDGENISFSSQSDSNGIAISELYDYHTKEAGTYYVSANSENYIFFPLLATIL